MRTRSSLLRASWARRSDSRPAHLMVLSLSEKYDFIFGRKMNHSWGFHLASDIFVGESSSLTSCVLIKNIDIPFPVFPECTEIISKLHFFVFTHVSKANHHQRNPDLINTWKGTQAGQNSTPVLSSLLTGSTLGCSTPPLLGPAPSSCSSHGLTGAFSPFMEFRDLLKCYNLLADSNHLNIFCFVLSHAGKGDRVKLFFY